MKTLIVITGPTGSGKTSLAIDLARELGCEIISADSRQVFRDIPIGTAAPTAAELEAVRHHLVGFLPLDGYYSAARFEEDAMGVLEELFSRSDYAVICGGSMLYVDAVVKGIDDIPTISPEIREQTLRLAAEGGNDALLAELQRLDPEYFAIVDRSNTKRLVHAVEICRQSGVTYSSLRSGRAKQRPFRVVKMFIDFPREELFNRINLRVEKMMEQGLLEEARRVYPLRELNSLNTVGYKELFAFFDGKWDLPTAIARIQKNTRVFAKKQLTWLRRPENLRAEVTAVPLDPSEPLLPQALALVGR